MKTTFETTIGVLSTDDFFLPLFSIWADRALEETIAKSTERKHLSPSVKLFKDLCGPQIAEKGYAYIYEPKFILQPDDIDFLLCAGYFIWLGKDAMGVIHMDSTIGQIFSDRTLVYSKDFVTAIQFFLQKLYGDN